MTVLKTMAACAALFASCAAAGAAAAPSAPAARPAGDEAALRAAQEALAAFDGARLYADKAHAQEMLGHAELLSAHAAGNKDVLHWLDNIRLVALDALDRDKEVLALGRQLSKTPGASPLVFAVTAVAAGAVNAPEAALETLETAAAGLDAEGAAEMRMLVHPGLADWMMGRFGMAQDKESRDRLAEAALTLGLPEPDDIGRRDWYRVYAIDRRMKAGDIAGARKLAREVKGPSVTLRLLTAKRYAALFDPDEDAVPLIEAAVARENRYTRERLEAEPDDPRRILERAQALRQRALEEDALALLLPASADLDAVAKGGTDAQWVVNEAVFSLIALGRTDEAVKLMEKLLTLDMEEHEGLINMAINHGNVLSMAGRHRDAAAWSEALNGRADGFASDYGYMWIWSNAACAHALAGDKAAAAPWLARLKEKSAVNRSAHIRALLCLDDLAGAEAVMVERLNGDDADAALAALQDYRLGEFRTEMARLLETRWEALRARPAVQAAIEKAGRILPLPLSKIYWGDY